MNNNNNNNNNNSNNMETKKTKKPMMTKPLLWAMVDNYWKLISELGTEVPTRILTNMVDTHADLERWLDDLPPQATWPKNHGNEEGE
ncbi:MAG: hypothetical protein CMF69_00930 [Magnetovibrio sp.]|nr:hypothetical protein [Magnetovibrio sp.]|tara:strand:+ start:893 stop:1153 length:261 start_codon:yes stop_codon:yes gene_type:complete